MAPHSSFPEQSYARWVTLSEVIASHEKFEDLVSTLCQDCHLAGGKPRQAARVREWFATTLPSAPFALDVIRCALKLGIIDLELLNALLTDSP